ncbi:MAG: KTSC domain-containing protein [Pseudomonadota bacterium]
MPFVNSSAIHRIEWENGTLSIWFLDSGRYDYFGVERGVFNSFLNAHSKGSFFNSHIRDRY